MVAPKYDYYGTQLNFDLHMTKTPYRVSLQEFVCCSREFRCHRNMLEACRSHAAVLYIACCSFLSAEMMSRQEHITLGGEKEE